MSESPPPSPSPGLSRRELVWLLAALLLGAVLFRAALDDPLRRHNPDEGQWSALAAFYAESDIGLSDCVLPSGHRPLHFLVYVVADRLFGTAAMHRERWAAHHGY